MKSSRFKYNNDTCDYCHNKLDPLINWIKQDPLDTLGAVYKFCSPGCSKSFSSSHHESMDDTPVCQNNAWFDEDFSEENVEKYIRHYLDEAIQEIKQANNEFSPHHLNKEELFNQTSQTTFHAWRWAMIPLGLEN